MNGETWVMTGETRETWVKGESERKCMKYKYIKTTLSLLSPIHPLPSLSVYSRVYACTCEGG